MDILAIESRVSYCKFVSAIDLRVFESSSFLSLVSIDSKLLPSLMSLLGLSAVSFDCCSFAACMEKNSCAMTSSIVSLSWGFLQIILEMRSMASGSDIC